MTTAAVQQAMGDDQGMDDAMQIEEIHGKYLEFLDDEDQGNFYCERVKAMVTKGDVRLRVNVNDLRKRNPERARALLSSDQSLMELMCFERALKTFVGQVNSSVSDKEYYIGLEGSFGDRHVTPRILSARHLGSIVCVEGVVTRCSLIRPKVMRSVHYCPATKKVLERKYTDMTSYDPFPSSSVYPKKDEDGNLLETEYGLSTYKDHQTLTIQEMPEKAPPGQLPRSVDIIADSDLVDVCKPGDRVQIIGVYRCMPNKQGYFTSGTFRTILLANNIKLLAKDVSPDMTGEDIKRCKSFARNKGDQVFDILARSLAPSIHGHEYVKKAILCMLLGGVEKNLSNGTRLRGDINILLIGDPSVAKSQLLRYVLYSAPRAITTTGRGSSGVGLTAAVTTDQETGERRLEAGAMVLADRGIVCIDEFDKMSDIDRTAIHEVMEQGRVTITKAGISAKLNARCSVLAAANPVYGRYDQYKTPMDNIGMQDSLLSRFDLLFIMLDKKDVDVDSQIADHVVRIHRYRAPGEQDGEPLPINTMADYLSTMNPDRDDREEADTQVYEKFDALLHPSKSRSQKIVCIPFMKKYLHLAKTMVPKLTEEAGKTIAEEYSRLRSVDLEKSDLAKTQPVTARTLETLIRLATAHAKARLSPNVEKKDAETAVELMQFALFHEVLHRKKRRRVEEGESEEEEEYMEDEEESAEQQQEASQESQRKRRRRVQLEDDEEGEAQLDQEESTPRSQRSRRGRGSPQEEAMDVEISDDRMKKFKALLNQEFKKTHAQSLPLDQIVTSLGSSSEKFSAPEIDKCLQKMQDDNNIMLSDDIVFLI